MPSESKSHNHIYKLNTATKILTGRKAIGNGFGIPDGLGGSCGGGKSISSGNGGLLGRQTHHTSIQYHHIGETLYITYAR